jgi:hypothetical protein
MNRRREGKGKPMRQLAVVLFIVVMLTTITSMTTITGAQNVERISPQTSSPKTMGAGWSEVARLTASDGAQEDIFGTAVAIDTETAIVGAPDENNYRGAAYIYTNSEGDWSETQKITVTTNLSVDAFGVSVSLDDDTAIIGASGDYGATGAAYIFIRSNTSWVQQVKLKAPDGSMLDHFGDAVAISGDIAVIGAPGWHNDTGAAYVFARTGTTWTLEATLTAPGGAPGDDFAWRLALDNQTIIIGACQENSNRGAAYVFVHSGSSWVQEARLTAADGAENDCFGISVSISGDTAIIGAPWNDDVLGAVYVFTRSATTWTQTGKLVPSSPTLVTGFGYTVSVSQNYVAVSAPWDMRYTGAVYVFKNSHGAWGEDTILRADDGAQDDFFGTSLSLWKTTLIIGSPDHDEYTGEAYIYRKPAPEFLLNISKPGVTLSLTNIGDADATNVTATLVLDGGLILVGREKTQDLGLLAETDTKQISLGFVFGFGKPTITGSITCDEGVSAQATATARVFLFFIFGIR